jgi:IS5 family transposase
MKWRTGCEGRISHLKRNYGWDRTMIDSTEGARIWTGHGVLAHNLAKIAALTASHQPRWPNTQTPNPANRGQPPSGASS